jgi:hypothetical protein
MNMTNQRRWIGAITLVAAGTFLLAAGIIVSRANRVGQSDAPSSAAPSDGVARVSLPEAYSAYQDGSAILVDVRSASSRSVELNPADWIITVCS